MSVRACYDEGVLRSFLDDALPSAERTVVAAHIAECHACQNRLEDLRVLAAASSRLLTMPRTVPDPAAALARLRKAEPIAGGAGIKVVGKPSAPRPNTFSWRDQIMRSFYRWQPQTRRPLFAGAAFAVLAVGLLLFPPVRAAADQLLQLFRVQSVVFVPISPERIRQLENLDFDKDTLFIGKPQAVNQPAPPRTVDSIAEAAKLLSFTPVQPTQFPAAPSSTELRVSDRQVGQLQVNVAAARQLLSLMDVDDVTIPDTLGAAPIVVDLQPALESHYRGDDYELELLQGVSPTVKLPDGVDLPQLGKAALRLLGMDPAQADAVSRSVDWSSTLLFPFPANVREIQQVTVGNAPGLLVGSDGEQGSRWQMYWQQGDRFYVLQGRSLNETEMIQVAESIR